jgi:hypothetical protein
MPIRQVALGSADELASFATSAVKTNSAAIVADGADYAVDDILVVLGGSAEMPTTLKVTTIGGLGEVTGIAVEAEGAYSTAPSNPVSVAGGSGSGATFNLTTGLAMTQATVVKAEKYKGYWHLFWYV